MKDKLWTISELADALGITARTIRFYEDKGLLQPRRVGANRVYNYKDQARLKLILRGKRLGFSLQEINEYIELYDTELDPLRTEQLGYLLDKVRDRINDLQRQQDDLQEMRAELGAIEQECLNCLNNNRMAS
ncbi:MAG: MerR family DNA-binding transcriptional regulator [Thiolinea sp.]